MVGFESWTGGRRSTTIEINPEAAIGGTISWSSCRGLREEDSGCGWMTLAADTGDGGREGYPEQGLV